MAGAEQVAQVATAVAVEAQAAAAAVREQGLVETLAVVQALVALAVMAQY